MAEKLFVVGAQKTSTSTILGIVNLYKNIYLEYELLVNPKYKQKFLNRRPTLEYLFNITDKKDFYNTFAEIIPEFHKKDYKYVGDKIATTDYVEFSAIADSKVIFTFRDIRTWLAKSSVGEIYDGKSLQQITYDYLTLFLNAFKLKHKLMISMEDFIANNFIIRQKIDLFLGMNNLKITERWWKKIGDWKESNPKYSSMWWSGHRTSRVIAKKQDVVVKLKEHKFWNFVLPMFDKYNKYYKTNKAPNPNEIDIDLKLLSKIFSFNVNHSDLYNKITPVALIKRDVKEKPSLKSNNKAKEKIILITDKKPELSTRLVKPIKKEHSRKEIIKSRMHNYKRIRTRR